MLWYKGWLETRIKLAIAFGFVIVLLAFLYLHPVAAARGATPAVARMQAFSSLSVMWISILLAGAGIATQPAFQAVKGIHGSILFTLSMPVSRLRLLAVRVSIGWLETAALVVFFCCGIWLLSPAAAVPGMELLEYAGTLTACASTIYFVSVLLATFLEEQWRIWGTMMAVGVLWWASRHAGLPAFADIFRAMGKNSPLTAHAMPWDAMGFSLGLSAVLFFAALKIVQMREY